MTIAESIRDAIERSGQTRYAIAKGAGMDYDVLARFLDQDRDLRLSNVQRLADYFGMRLTKPKKGGRQR